MPQNMILPSLKLKLEFDEKKGPKIMSGQTGCACVRAYVWAKTPKTIRSPVRAMQSAQCSEVHLDV